MKKILRNVMLFSFITTLFIFGKKGVTQAEQFIENNLLFLAPETTDTEMTLVSASNQLETTDYLIKITSAEAQLYQTADVSSKKLLEINKGELVELKETKKDFYKVQTTNGLSGYVQLQDGEKIEYSQQEVPSDLSEAIIVLDAGHGGEDTGAISNDETLYEKEITLQTALTVQSYLEAQGAAVILTRSNDTMISLNEICEISIAAKADVFISFHFDSTDYMNEASGTTTYYYYQQYKKLAETINQTLEQWLPLQNRGIEYGNYQVLRESTQPSLLLELGYMNNDNDLATFYTADYQANVAKALVEGLTSYFNQQQTTS